MKLLMCAFSSVAYLLFIDQTVDTRKIIGLRAADLELIIMNDNYLCKV